jgi:hypothetical protein
MDTSTIVSQALTFLAPFLTKGGEELVSGAAKDLWQLIKKPFTTDKEKQLLRGLEKSPGDLEQRGMVKLKLTEKLDEDPHLLNEIVSLLAKLQSQQGAKTSVGIQHHTGSGDNVAGDKIINQL